MLLFAEKSDIANVLEKCNASKIIVVQNLWMINKPPNNN